MIIIADAHLGLDDSAEPEFFKMLESLEDTAEDLVFLGDIFDLWIGYKRYESPLQRNFMAWCAKEKHKRAIYFVEGNHEFFINQKRRAAFSVYNNSVQGLVLGGALFVHGDLVNYKDKNYRRFRWLVKNPVIGFFVRVTPCGPKIVHYFKNGLKKTNRNFRKYIPKAEIMEFAAKAGQNGVSTIFMGHFHHGEILKAGDVTVCMLPDWYKTRQVACFDPAQHQLSFRCWREVLA